MLEKLRLVFPRGQYEVFPAIHLADLIELSGSVDSGQEASSALGELERWQVDYVVCKKASSEIVAAVDLEDSKATRPAARDARKTAVLAAAGIKLFRVRVEDDAGIQGLSRAVGVS